MRLIVQATEFREGWKQLRREMKGLGTGVGMELRFFPDGRFEGNADPLRVGRGLEGNAPCSGGALRT